MEQNELGHKSKEVLSWMIISEVLRQSALDLDIAVLHPGGGQYDTLSLVTFEGNSIVHVNRNGVNALANDTLVETIFDIAAQSPADAASMIIKVIDSDPEKNMTAKKKIRIESAVKIANYLALNIQYGAHCEWAWVDSPYGIGPNELLSNFQIPDEWKKQEGLFVGTTWESGVYLLFWGDSPIVAVNMVTGEFVNPKGLPEAFIPTLFEDGGLARPHIGFRLTIEDVSGNFILEDEVQVADVRRARHHYSKENYSLPNQIPIFEFTCGQEDAILKWIFAEKEPFLSIEELLDQQE